MRARLLNMFDGVVVYHAARPLSVQSYYREGLLLGDRSAQTARAREVFLSGRFPEITEEVFATADKNLRLDEDGRAFVALDPRVFFAYAGHYLIYGSEYLGALATGLCCVTGRECRQALKEFGVPTLFRLRLPFGSINPQDLEALAGELHESVPSVRKGRGIPRADFTFCLRQSLPCDSVLSHEHPPRIVDPLDGMRPYVW